MRFKKLFLYTSLILSNASVAKDADSIFNLTLDELINLSVVTAASGFEQKVSRAPATVSIITAEQWQASGARFLSDVLATVPGVHVSKPYVNYKHQKFIIRGLSGSETSEIKLLIDGEPIENMQDSGLFNGFHMPLSSFKRIEVIKGPGSVVYGADAFGGIINLVSYSHDEQPSEFGVNAGSFDSYAIYAGNKHNLGDARLQWSFNYSRSRDDKNRIVSADLQSLFDGIFNTSASNAPGRIDEHYEILSLLAKWQWQQWQLDYYSWRNFDGGVGAGIAQALDPGGEYNVNFQRYKLSYDFSARVNGELKASYLHTSLDSHNYLHVFPAGAVLPIGSDGNANFVDPAGFTLFEDGYIGTPGSSGHTDALHLTHIFTPASQQLLRWELGYERLSFNPTESKNFGPSILDGNQALVDGELTDVAGTPYIFLPPVTRSFYYLSAQDEWQLNDKLQLTLGLRFDHYSDFGNTSNPRAGLIWQASDKLSLKLFSGTAFKAPTIVQLYAQNNPVGLGNPKLQAASVNTLETGANMEYFINENLVVSLSLFDYHARDLVEYVFDEQRQGNVATNVGEQRGRGGEFWLKYKPRNNITLDANYSYLSAQNNDGRDIANVPTDMAFVGINWQLNDNWQWNLSAKWLANRSRPESDNRPAPDDYIWVNGKIERRNLIPGLSLALVSNNLLDSSATEPSNGSIPDDYPLPGRQWLLELNYRF